MVAGSILDRSMNVLFPFPIGKIKCDFEFTAQRNK